MSKDAERNAQIQAHNDAVIAAGKSEIDSGHLAHQRRREAELERGQREKKSKGGGLGGLLKRKPVGSEEQSGIAGGTEVRRHY